MLLLLTSVVVAFAGSSQDAVVVTPVTPPATVKLAFPDAPTALKNLHFEGAVTSTNASEQRLGAALQRLVDGSRDDGLAAFVDLVDDEDAWVRNTSRDIVSQLRFDRAEYATMLEELTRWNDAPSELAKELGTLPTPSVSLAATPVDASLKRGLWGLPVMAGRAAGKPVSWLFDTGAEFTLLTASEAERLGVQSRATDVQMGTSTSHEQTGRFAVLDRLEMGAMVFENLPVLILPDSALQWEVDGVAKGFTGIVGWNASRYARTTLDMPKHEYTMEVPVPVKKARNLFWLDSPVVRMRGVGGQPLAFFYDSGSSTTDMTANLASKIDLGRVRKKKVSVGGAGSVERVRVPVAEVVPLVIGAYRFDIPAMMQGVSEATFIVLDGRLGSDVAQTCVVTVDAPNGIYDMDCR